MDRSKPKALTLMIYTLYTNNNTLHTLGRSRGVALPLVTRQRLTQHKSIELNNKNNNHNNRNNINPSSVIKNTHHTTI